MGQSNNIKVYGYRWVILAIYFLITLTIEVQWLTFASIASAAQDFYKASSLEIDFFSIIYMVIFIIMSIPASYIIDTYGLRPGLLIGAAMTGIFGLMKWVFADSYIMVAIAQTGLAIAQPFILNAVTKIGANWFPRNERATVAGLGSLAQYIGIIIALALTPQLIKTTTDGTFILQDMLKIYGILSIAISAIVIILMRDKPPTAPSESDMEERINVFAGMKHIFKTRDMLLLLLLFFIGLGIFNAVSTCIDQICHTLTMEQTGVVGGVMLIGGVIGALILPALSDRFRKRKPFLILCMALMIPGLAGLTFFPGYSSLMISAFAFGFFIMSAGPIGFQYGAEKSYPAPESTTQGIILLVGQISGILFVLGVNSFGVKTAMIAFIVFTFINVVLSLRLTESFDMNKSSSTKLSK